MKQISRIFYFILIISVCAFCIGIGSLSHRVSAPEKEIRRLTFEETAQGSKNPLILEGHFSEDVKPQEQILMYVHRMDVQLRQNGKLVYTYHSAGQYEEFTRSVGTDWACFTTEGIESADMVQITLIPLYDDIYEGACKSFLQNLYVGDRDALLQQELGENAGQILISLLILIVGIAFLVTMTTLRIMGTPVARGYFACGMLLVCGAICTFIDYDYITLLFRNAFTVNLVDYLMQILICAFMLIYFRDNLKNKVIKNLVSMFVVLWALMTALFVILQGLKVADGIQLMSIASPYALILILITIFCMIVDYKRQSDSCDKLILAASLLLCVSTGAEIYNYYSNFAHRF